MSLTKNSLETLIDLVEIKLSCMEVFDRDDAREVANLEACLKELRELAGLPDTMSGAVVAFPPRTRGRPRAVA